MSFLSMAHMYQVVRDMYDGPKWREKVNNMSDDQIMAIYFSREEREKASVAKQASRKKNLKRTLQKKIEEVRGRTPKTVESCDGSDSSTDDEIPEQLSFFD